MRVVGRSGIVMDLRESLARGLIRSGAVQPVGESADRPPEQAPAPAPVADEPEPASRAPEPAEGSDPTVYVCDVCGAGAKSPAGLASHKRRAHPAVGA